MHTIFTTVKSVQTQAIHLLKYALYALVLLPVVAGFLAYRAWGNPAVTANGAQPATGITVITPEMLTERFGVKIQLLGVTAANGMIDFRYKVLDKEKAAFLIGNGNNPPSLIDEKSGTTLTMDSSMHGMNHNTRLKNNQIYFHFYPNVPNAIKPGSFVTVDFGSVRLTSLQAQ